MPENEIDRRTLWPPGGNYVYRKDDAKIALATLRNNITDFGFRRLETLKITGSGQNNEELPTGAIAFEFAGAKYRLTIESQGKANG